MLRRVSLQFPCTLATHSQPGTGSQIGGVVDDVTGAAIAESDLTITSLDTSDVRASVGGAEGADVVTSVTPEFCGPRPLPSRFSIPKQPRVTLQADSNPASDVPMQVASGDTATSRCYGNATVTSCRLVLILIYDLCEGLAPEKASLTSIRKAPRWAWEGKCNVCSFSLCWRVFGS